MLYIILRRMYKTIHLCFTRNYFSTGKWVTKPIIYCLKRLTPCNYIIFVKIHNIISNCFLIKHNDKPSNIMVAPDYKLNYNI